MVIFGLFILGLYFGDRLHLNLNLFTKWGIKWLIFLILLITIFIQLNSAIPSNPNKYFASLIDKHELLKTTPSPRIIIVGGSNVAFAIDSETLSEELNTPVINLGVTFGFGLRFMLNDTAQFINQGDLVVISPEYELFYNDVLEGYDESLAILLSVYPQAINAFDIFQIQRLGEVSIKIMQLKLRQLILLPVFRSEHDQFGWLQRSGLNRYGDFIAHLGLDPILIPDDPIITDDDIFNQTTIKVLNQFHKEAQSKGVKVVLIFPATRNTNCEMTDARLEELENILRNQLEMPILNNFRSSCYPDELFFDHQYHPNWEGRQIRTHELIELLQNLD